MSYDEELHYVHMVKFKVTNVLIVEAKQALLAQH